MVVQLLHNMTHKVLHMELEMSGRVATARPNVPVRERLRRDLREHPEAYGFEAGTSEARILEELVEVGARVKREAVRREARIEVYRAWAADPEAREATREAMKSALDHGLV